MMCLGGFYWFQKFWKFSPKIARFSGKKANFFKNIKQIWKQKFPLKVLAFKGKWSNWPTNWYKCSLWYQEHTFASLFGYFAFFAVLWDLKVEKGPLFAIFKNCIWMIVWVVKNCIFGTFIFCGRFSSKLTQFFISYLKRRKLIVSNF